MQGLGVSLPSISLISIPSELMRRAGQADQERAKGGADRIIVTEPVKLVVHAWR